MSELLESLVKSGRFSSATEAVHGALLLLRDEPLEDAEDLGDLREEVQAGLAQLGAVVRSLPLGEYLIIRRPVRGGIELVRFVHGSRNLRRMFRRRRPRE